jgi:transposase-like protein
VAKRRLRRHTKEFRAKAVERMKSGDNVVALARELDVHRRLLYQWREEQEGFHSSKRRVPSSWPMASI